MEFSKYRNGYAWSNSGPVEGGNYLLRLTIGKRPQSLAAPTCSSDMAAWSGGGFGSVALRSG
jgi:hypothetical protein